MVDFEDMYSYQAYDYCKNVKDVPEARNKIRDSYDAYRYCYNIK